MNKLRYLSLGNSKMRASGEGRSIVAAFSLPAGGTCPRAGECRKWCYAQVGAYAYPVVKAWAAKNFELTQTPFFGVEMSQDILLLRQKAAKKGKGVVIRIHDSGDFYSTEYMEKWAQVVEAHPDVEFYAYTKSWVLLSTHRLVSLRNFSFIPSLGGKDDALLLASGLAYAYAFPERGSPFPGSVETNDDDVVNLRAIQSGWCVGLRAHGARKSKVA